MQHLPGPSAAFACEPAHLFRLYPDCSQTAKYLLGREKGSSIRLIPFHFSLFKDVFVAFRLFFYYTLLYSLSAIFLLSGDIIC